MRSEMGIIIIYIQSVEGMGIAGKEWEFTAHHALCLLKVK